MVRLMPGSKFGSSIDTAEIDDGSITYAKLASDARIDVPIGGIIPWLKSFTGTPALGDVWVECNGQVLDDGESVFDGDTIPDLNGDNRFIRGDSASGNTGGSETHTHPLSTDTFGDNGDGGTSRRVLTSTNTQATSTLPTYYSVVWIMRIK